MDSIADHQATSVPDAVSTRFGETRGSGSIFWAPWVLLRFLGKLALDSYRGEVDVLHINLASRGSTYRKLVVAQVARWLGIPYVLHLHGARFHHFLGDASPRVGRRVKGMFSGAARVLVLGEVWRRFLVEEMPDVADRVVVLPNATPEATLARVPSQTVRFLFLGRVGQRKGVPQLIEALGRLPRDGAWHAIIAGDGDVAASRARLVELKLEGLVELPGWVGPNHVSDLLAAADILVLPSQDENLPMSVIEAMAAGLAVVTTPVGAIEDIIEDGVTGILVPPGDVHALTAALLRLLQDPALRRQLGRAAQSTHAERLEIGRYVAQLESIWRAVVDEAARR